MSIVGVAGPRKPIGVCHARNSGIECDSPSAYWLQTDVASETPVCERHAADARRRFPDQVLRLRTLKLSS